MSKPQFFYIYYNFDSTCSSLAVSGRCSRLSAALQARLTLVLGFCFYAHLLLLGVKKAPRRSSIRTTNMFDSKSQSGVFDHGEFKENVPKWVWKPDIEIWPPKDCKTPKQHVCFIFHNHKCAEVQKKTWLLPQLYVNVWGVFYHQTVTISPRILIFPAWVAVLAFPAVGRCRTHL